MTSSHITVRPIHLIAGSLTAAMVLFGSIPAGPPAGARTSPQDLDLVAPSEMRDFIDRYSTNRAGLQRFYSIGSSPVRLDRLDRFYREWRERLEEVDFTPLDLYGRIDWLLMRTHLDRELVRIEHERERLAEVEPLMPYAAAIIEFEESRRRMEPLDPRQAAERLNTITEQVEKLQQAMQDSLQAAGPEGEFYLGQPIVLRATRISNQLIRTLKSWFEYFTGYQPMFNWWTNDAYEKADKALKDYVKFLREKVLGAKEGEPEPVIGDPIGREALLDELAFEMIPYTPEELVELAWEEYHWCENEYKRAAGELGYGDDWQAAVEYVKTLHVAPGRQDSLIRELATEAIRFLDEHELVTIPELARETWRIEMMSEESQQTTPYFTYGGQRINVSYPTDSMTYEQKLMSMRGNNIHFSRATVQHELIPGHHLQGFAAERYRTWRRVFRTAFLVEGWALHWEMLLWDLGFPQSPENRIGMIFWRIHRAARIIVSLKFHLGEMTPEEMIDFLVERVGHERDGATSEVRRYVGEAYGPLYQCAYLVGGWQLRALHGELVGSGQMTNRAFHDAVLRENSIPIEMIRLGLTAETPRRNWRPGWRFKDD